MIWQVVYGKLGVGRGLGVGGRGWREGRFRVIYAQKQTPGRKGF